MADAVVRFRRKGAIELAALPPLALYVHLPWCLKKCPYCDFNSHEAPRLPPVATPRGGSGSGPAEPDPRLALVTTPRGLAPEAETRYVDALIADLEASLPQVWGRRIASVFIGGGTPSLFSPEAIDRLLAAVRARLALEPGCEVTLEANPGTFERERFRAYRGAGVTRLSIGVQSFDDAALQAIGRVHDAAQARAAVEEAAAAFDTFNIDLMYALPGQTLAALDADLAAALACRPPHLSVYHLTLEPNTWFASHPPALPDDDLASEMLDRIVERTGAAGLQRYEVSAFARAGHRCAHNLNYWHFGDYLGLGAGAHGKLSFPDRIVRQVRWRDPATYIARALEGRAVSNENEVAASELPFEFMLNALRLKDGFESALFVERSGQSIAAIDATVECAVQRGLLQREGTRLRPTERGFDFLSDLQALFLAPGG
ncbi:MAG: YggW family oxidoreductase [Rubrivivax sp. SCN 70-15]|nr:MAG: YggW family oxidoreductase [Rubrivivax sp. SCN 70-15]